MERGTGFEPATIALEERDSTVELPPHRLSSVQPARIRAPLHSSKTSLVCELPAAIRNAPRKLTQMVDVNESIECSPRCALSIVAPHLNSFQRKIRGPSSSASRTRTTSKTP